MQVVAVLPDGGVKPLAQVVGHDGVRDLRPCLRPRAARHSFSAPSEVPAGGGPSRSKAPFHEPMRSRQPLRGARAASRSCVRNSSPIPARRRASRASSRPLIIHGVRGAGGRRARPRSRPRRGSRTQWTPRRTWGTSSSPTTSSAAPLRGHRRRGSTGRSGPRGRGCRPPAPCCMTAQNPRAEPTWDAPPEPVAHGVLSEEL